jgi:CRISPR-associated protein Csm4
VTDFLELRACLNEMRLLEQLAVTQGEAETQETPGQGRRKRVQVAHHTINRLTGTAPEAGGLYFTDEDWSTGKACELDVYVITAMNAAAVQALFTQVGEFGYGRDANLGRGRFTAEVETAKPDLFDYTGNRLLSLSHGMVSTNMAETFYRLHTHYGKLGGLYAGSAYPFKYPLLLARPGATFRPLDRGPFGKLLSGIHPRHPQICHNAWHLCLPFTAA